MLAQLSEALEQQQQALRATLAKLEAELPPEQERRLYWREERPEWLTVEWWDGLPAGLREGLVLAPAGPDLSA